KLLFFIRRPFDPSSKIQVFTDLISLLIMETFSAIFLITKALDLVLVMWFFSSQVLFDLTISMAPSFAWLLMVFPVSFTCPRILKLSLASAIRLFFAIKESTRIPLGREREWSWLFVIKSFFPFTLE